MGHDSMSGSLMEIKSSKLNPNLKQMINETWDALESMSFKVALEDCLDATFRVFCDQIHAECFRSSSVDDSTLSKNVTKNDFKTNAKLDEGGNRINDQDNTTDKNENQNQEEDVVNDENDKPNSSPDQILQNATIGIEFDNRKSKELGLNSLQTTITSGLQMEPVMKHEEEINMDQSTATNNTREEDIVKKPL